MQLVTLNVQGMSCGHCVNTIESSVKRLGAIAQVNLAAGTVTVQFNENNIELNAIKQTIEEQGYDVVS